MGDGRASSDRGAGRPALRDVGPLLRALRAGRLLTQEELADAAGVSVRTVRSLEGDRPRPPRPETVRRLADALQVTGDERRRFEAACAGRAVPSPTAVPTPETLPPAARNFCGRTNEIDHVVSVLVPEPHGGVVGVPIATVVGKPGVGKTALALQVAHRLQGLGRFPDGRLYANLGAAGPAPSDPSDVLARFLSALGVEGAAMPAGADERGDLYRSLLAARRVLVVLDDASDEGQVRPLLPGGTGCAALVTSRGRLGGLDVVSALDLDVLPPADALALLAVTEGGGRVVAEPVAASALVDYCGRLPLALRIAGARLAAHPGLSLARFGDRLADERRRLDELSIGDQEVRAGFSVSYRSLSPGARQLFRRLGQLPYPDVPAWPAAALVDRPLLETEKLLDRLVDAHLLEITGTDRLGQTRYRFHDLLRVYAAELAAADDASTRRDALERVTGTWLHLAERATPLVRAGTLTLTHGEAARVPPDDSVTVLVLADPLAWFETERLNLTSAVLQAEREGLDDAAWDLAGCAALFHALRSYFDDWRRTQEAGLAAARRAGRRRGEAHLLRGLGHVLTEQDRLERATDSFRAARALFSELDDRAGEAMTLDDLGVTALLGGRPDEALPLLRAAEAIVDGLGDQVGRAHVRFSLGILHLDLGEYDPADRNLREAEATLAATDDLYTLAQIRRKVAQLRRATGRLADAATALQQCLTVDRALGDTLGEALTRQSLGEVYRRQGREREALTTLDDALVTFRVFGYAYGEALVRRSLGALHLTAGRPSEALGELRPALATWRRLGRRRHEADTLTSIGDALAALHDRSRAEQTWREALRAWEELGGVEAVTVRERLRSAPGRVHL